MSVSCKGKDTFLKSIETQKIGGWKTILSSAGFGLFAMSQVAS